MIPKGQREAMFDHIGFTVSHFELSKNFYELALAPLGIKALVELPPEILGPNERVLGFGIERPQFWINTGPRIQPGIHLAFTAESRAIVAAFYKAALAAGGTDNGAPGLRPHYHEHYYGAFVRDPDGHNIEAVCHKPG